MPYYVIDPDNKESSAVKRELQQPMNEDYSSAVPMQFSWVSSESTQIARRQGSKICSPQSKQELNLRSSYEIKGKLKRPGLDWHLTLAYLVHQLGLY